MSAPVAPLLVTSFTPAHRFAIVVRSALRSVVAVVRAVRHRREVATMLTMDNRMLKDIGLNRNDVLGALAEPWAHDPSVVLRIRSVDHRARQRAADRRSD